MLYNYRKLYLGANVKTQLSAHSSSTRGRVSDSWPPLFHCVGENTWEELIPYRNAPLCAPEPRWCWGGRFPGGGWGGGEAAPRGAFRRVAPGPRLAAEDHVRAVLWAGGPGSLPGSPGCNGTCLITGAQPRIRREDGDGPLAGLLCFRSLQVPHLQPWALHPRACHGQTAFACFIHRPARAGLMKVQDSTQTVPVSGQEALSMPHRSL